MTAIKTAGPQQAAELARLHARAFTEHDAWGAPAMAAVLELPSTHALMIYTQSVPAGFIIIQQVADEAEVLTLAIDPQFHRHGLARKLLLQAVRQLLGQGVTRLVLDVASDNDAAIGLYESLGFTQDGLRKAYYSRPGQARMDALLMSRSISGQDDP
ncbi:MAG: ribosomal protein S18-alanine N-acetyltransferase [Alphaproteobacteria bacterium]|nr:ribosomal protein S18-alanine N-acetyltransferase [Alphaproteobacteria bacterium]